MAVKLRLMRMGKKKQPTYRVVAADARSPRDGRFIDQIGRYDPRVEPSVVEIDNDKAVDWLRKGAQPTEPVRRLLEISGAWSAYKVARGEIHTVGAEAPEARATARKETADQEMAVAEEPAQAALEEPVAEAAVEEPVAETAEPEEES